MIQKIITWFGGEKRFYIVLITLILMWLLLIGFFYLKADEVTKHPCSICAKQLNEEVTCFVGEGIIKSRVYYPNFDINDSKTS